MRLVIWIGGFPGLRMLSGSEGFRVSTEGQKQIPFGNDKPKKQKQWLVFFRAAEAGVAQVQFAFYAAEGLVVDAAFIAEADGGFAFDAGGFAGDLEEA